MKRLPLIVTILATMMASSCCEQNVDCCAPPPVDLLPLNVGNSWTMKPKSGAFGFSTNFRVIYKIDKRELLDGIEYYRMVSNVGTPDSNSEEIQYYRVFDEEVFVRGDQSEEEVIYRMNAEPGEQWNYSSGLMQLSTRAEYQFVNSDTTLFDCRWFSYDKPRVIDEESVIVMAPFIGFVSVESAETRLELSEAVIGGKTHVFF